MPLADGGDDRRRARFDRPAPRRGLLPLTVAVLDVGGHLVRAASARTAPATSAPTSPSARRRGALGMGIFEPHHPRPAEGPPGVSGRDRRGVGRPLHSGAGRRAGAERQGRRDRRGRDLRRRLRQGRIRRHHRRASRGAQEPSGAAGASNWQDAGLYGLSSGPLRIEPDTAGYIIGYISLLWSVGPRQLSRRSANGARQAKQRERLRRHPRHLRVRRRPLAPGLSAQHVLHVADEGGEPQGLQGERGEVPQAVSS